MPSPQYLPRDRHDLGGPGHRAVKTGVEARDLRHTGDGADERLDQRDLAGQVFRIEWADPPQLIEHRRRDQFRLDEPVPPVDDAVPDGRHRGETAGVLDPLNHQFRCRGLVRCLDPEVFPLTAGGTRHDQSRIPLPDSLDTSREDPLGQIGRCENRELEAGRSAVDRQDAGWRRLPAREPIARKVAACPIVLAIPKRNAHEKIVASARVDTDWAD